MTFDFEETRTKATARKNVLSARLQEISKEKARLEEEEKQIQVELVALDQIIDGITYMEAGEMPSDFEQLGFRGQIEKILKDHVPAYILPTQIREKLEAAGITGSTPRNLLISIHTILGRLDKDKLIETKERNGRTAYRWKQTDLLNQPTISIKETKRFVYGGAPGLTPPPGLREKEKK